jgi:preprotein translocase subunit Sec63
MEATDYYRILQVDPLAEPEVIEAARNRLSRMYHPDVNPSAGAAERMKQINAAYDVLSDPERRTRYDATRGPGNARPPRRRSLAWLWTVLLAATGLLLFRFRPRLGILFLAAWLVAWVVIRVARSYRR